MEVRSLKAACLMEILTGVTATPTLSSWDVFPTNDDDDDDDRCDGTWVSDSTDVSIVSSMQVSVTAVLICDLSSAIFRSDLVYCDDDDIDDDRYDDDGINDHDIGDDGFDVWLYATTTSVDDDSDDDDNNYDDDIYNNYK